MVFRWNRGVKMITEETRLESYLKTPTSQRQNMILEAMGDKEMSARMIAYKMGFSDLNAVKPRLTELKQKGIIVASGKAYDELTHRTVALFKKV